MLKQLALILLTGTLIIPFSALSKVSAAEVERKVVYTLESFINQDGATADVYQNSIGSWFGSGQTPQQSFLGLGFKGEMPEAAKSISSVKLIIPNNSVHNG